jgi:RNA-splicing ligase RtcB
MTEHNIGQFSWYLDITPNKMFSLYEYPIEGKDGLTLCEQHGNHLEMKEVVVYDREATEAFPPGHCWVCNE